MSRAQSARRVVPGPRTAPDGGADAGPAGSVTPLAAARADLAETATHTGTWSWGCVRDVVELSAALQDLLAPDVVPSGSVVLPGRLGDVLGLAVDRDRGPVTLAVATAWRHRASFEVNHHAGDPGAPSAVRHVGRVVTGEDGAVVGMVGAVTVLPAVDDADPFSDAETAMRHRNLVRVLPSAVIIHQDGVVVHANPAAHALIGERGPVELIGAPLLELVAPESRRPMMERILAMSAPGATAPAVEEEILLSDGTRVPVEVVSIRTTWRGRPAGQAVITDVRERRALLDRLTHDATHDALTGLGNRRRIEDELSRLLRGGRDFGVLFVDLDHFKEVNDSHGHAVGDDVLLQTVARLRQVVQGHADAFLGRLSGDEFLILTPDVAACRVLAEGVCEAVTAPFAVGGWKLTITASVGVLQAGVRCYDGHSPWDVIRDADVAMYRAKQEGRNRWVVFDETMRHKLQRRVTTTEYLRRAVAAPEAGGLHLVFQPIVEAGSGRPRAVETLVRWSDPDLGAVFPDEFIPLAEETGLIVPLGRWILRTACEQVATWRREHPGLAGLCAAVNLSPRQLADPGLVATTSAVLAEVGLPADALCLEITETALAEDLDAAYETVSKLRDLGVHLSIDDFGTGYSSLAYLRNLPVGEVKVDRSFVSGLGERIRDEKICASVISMAHALGLKVVAEGIETQVQLDHLREGGCDFVQGYFLCRPQPPAEVLEHLLRASR